MRLVNLTPVAIVIETPSGQRVLEPSGRVARLNTVQEPDESVDGVECVRTRIREVLGLPEATVGVVYVVSPLVGQFAHRHDVVCPDTGPTAIRDADGKLIAVRQMQRF